jgi:hypothetical protein
MNTSSRLIGTLDKLVEARYHGAQNIAGIRFQLLYSLLRAFDLYGDPAASEVQFEGIEDVDLKGLRADDVYIQVKSSKAKQGWGWFNKERILDHFIEAYRVNPNARFAVVTNFAFKGLLLGLERFCNEQVVELPARVRQKVSTIARRNGLDIAEVAPILRRISFRRINEQELLDRTRETLIATFEIDAGNEMLYLSRLFGCVTAWAAGRATIEQGDLEAERVRVQDWISLGPQNPAVRDRLIQQLDFAREQNPEDYYEGKRARPGHVLASLDAPRPKWQEEIDNRLKQPNVCVIKASSGQGKSTLVYRYAFDHFIPDAVYQLRACSREEHVGPIVDYLRNRLRLGLPLLVLVDNLSYSTRLWHQIAAELAGNNVRFLITTREEDWYRYGLGISGFVWSIVEPNLNLGEAKAIFHYFQREGRIAPNVPSAEWAYEQVADKKLLMEFVYLITHGQMLAERIEEQIRTIEQQGEDPAKLDVLRLVATAQVYGARVGIKSLLEGVTFRQDPNSTLKALEREYIECQDGQCEGLHFVRSNHLVNELHTVLPLEHTVKRLLELLDHTNMAALVSSAFSDQSIRHDDLLTTLVARCRRASLTLVNAVVEGLFVASETLYFRAHEHLFDAAVEEAGPSSLMTLTSSTLPTGDLNILEDLAGLFPDRPGIRFLNELVPQFQSRQAVGVYRVAHAFLESLLSTIPFNGSVSLADVATFSTWCQFFDVPASRLDEFFASKQWQSTFYQSDGEAASAFLYALFHRLPERHRRFVQDNKERLFSLFELRFNTLTVKEWNGDLAIEFVVEEGDAGLEPHEQAISRLRQLHQWFPQYDHYRSEGLYPSTGGQRPELDESRKTVDREGLEVHLHAARNAIYTQLVEEHYSPQLAFDWARHWDSLRRRALEFGRALVSEYEDVYRGRQLDIRDLISVGSDLELLCRQAPGLPARLRSQFRMQQKTIQGWTSSMLAFLQQFFQHDPGDSQDRQSYLMRYNLKDAVKKLPAMHQAFADIFLAEPDHFDMTELDEHESATYAYLRDILDYWFNGPRGRVRKLRTAVRRWHEAQRHTFATRVRDRLTPLAEAGMEFMYPVAPLVEHPLTGLCLGYEVLDFERQEEQVGSIAITVARLDINYDFLYLIPTVLQHQFGALITRVRRDTLQHLAGGEQVERGIYPVVPPEGLYTVLPNLNPRPLPDVALVLEMADVRAYLVMERNKLYFAQSRLNGALEPERALLRRYERGAKTRLRELLETFDHLYAKAQAYRANEGASAEWLALWERTATLIHSLAELDDLSTDYTPQPATQSAALESLLAKYMNRRYLSQ